MECILQIFYLSLGPIVAVCVRLVLQYLLTVCCSTVYLFLSDLAQPSPPLKTQSELVREWKNEKGGGYQGAYVISGPVGRPGRQCGGQKEVNHRFGGLDAI